MDYSQNWKQIFPVSSVFFPPNLLPSPSSPLNFTPDSPPFPLFTSPSLLPHLIPLPPPPLHLHSLNSFLSSQTPHVNSFIQDISPQFPSPPFPSTNLLISLPSSLNPNTLHLFFPTGENADYIAYLSITLPSKELILHQNGDVFIQKEGFKHPGQRILTLNAVSCLNNNNSNNNNNNNNKNNKNKNNDKKNKNKDCDGFVLATKLYSVDWFRVENQLIEPGKKTGKPNPVLVPLGSHGFEFLVLHACFSSYFSEESLVLLENGDLYWFNLGTKKSCKIRVRLNGDNEPVNWLSCEFGAKPWLVLVAYPKGVILVDLRNGEEGQNRNLCKIDNLGLHDTNPIEDRVKKIVAFCMAGHNKFHFSVLTEFQLMLFDIRQDLDPVLIWEHGLRNPNYITMFDLGQFGDFKNIFAILAGSFDTGEFNLFCYVNKNELEISSSSNLQALNLPCNISLNGQSEEQVLNNLFSEGVFVKDFESMRKNEKVVGFFVIPKNLSEPGLNGFGIIRLMSFGRLELQNYHVKGKENGQINGILKPCNEEINGISEPKPGDNLTICPNCERENLPSRRYFLDLKFLNSYLNNNLSETLAESKYQINEILISDNLSQLINDSLNYTSNLSQFINNASIPTNIFEIAIKTSLNNLKPDLMPLAFAKYSDLFVRNRDSSLQLLEVSRNSSEKDKNGPLFNLKPLRRGQKWSVKNEAPRERLVGPVLPVPVLLSLEERESNENLNLDLKCGEIFEIISPPISIAETEDQTENINNNIINNNNDNNKLFIVYEPECSNNMVCKNEKYETFICGVNNKVRGESNDLNLKPKSELGVIGDEYFDLGGIKLDFEFGEIEVQFDEKEAMDKLKNQFSGWLSEYKPYQDFCIHSKIEKCMNN